MFKIISCGTLAAFYIFSFLNEKMNSSYVIDNALIDTIVFKSNVKFESNIGLIIEKCIKNDNKTTPLTKESVLGLQKILNKELNTKVFKTMQIVTGASLNLEGADMKIDIMEWHFDSTDKVNKIERALIRLKDGIIWHTIAPCACKWVSCGKKIYIITYIPRDSTDYLINDIQKCIYENKK